MQKVGSVFSRYGRGEGGRVRGGPEPPLSPRLSPQDPRPAARGAAPPAAVVRGVRRLPAAPRAALPPAPAPLRPREGRRRGALLPRGPSASVSRGTGTAPRFPRPASDPRGTLLRPPGSPRRSAVTAPRPSGRVLSARGRHEERLAASNPTASGLLPAGNYWWSCTRRQGKAQLQQKRLSPTLCRTRGAPQMQP